MFRFSKLLRENLNIDFLFVALFSRYKLLLNVPAGSLVSYPEKHNTSSRMVDVTLKQKCTAYVFVTQLVVLL